MIAKNLDVTYFLIVPIIWKQIDQLSNYKSYKEKYFLKMSLEE